MAKPLDLAAPLATVVAVALLSVAPAGPEAITAVTGTPAPPAGLPAPSRTWSTGCWLNGAPLVAVGDGSVVIVSCAAAPAAAVALQDAGEPAPAACTGCVPAAAPRVQAGAENGSAPRPARV